MASKKKKQPESSGAAPWIVRGLIVVALAAVVMIGLKELRARQEAVASHAAVAGLLNAGGEESVVRKSQLKPLLQGNPRLETADGAALNSPTVATAEKYSWPGMIRTYSMTIGYSLGEDPEIEVVEGPK
jgi:hypothetical protein